MPKALERKLKKEAAKEGKSGKEADAFVYGTLRKTGWTPSTQKKPKDGPPKSDIRKLYS